MRFFTLRCRALLLSAAVAAAMLFIAGCGGDNGANQASGYTVTVLSVGAGASGGGNYAAGATVSISAGTAPTGQQFKNWTSSSDGVIFADANSATTTFIMPSNAVTVTAVFEAGATAATYAVTVSSAGTGAIGGGNYEAGATVAIWAGTAPADRQFKNWTSSGNGVLFADANNEITTFVMPANPVTVTAVFEAAAGLVFDLNAAQNGTNYGAKWFAYTYHVNNSGGTAIIVPAEGDGFQDGFFNANGSATLGVSTTAAQNVGVGFGFTWLDMKKDSMEINRDISAYQGVYITYTLTGSAHICVYINSDQINILGDNTSLTNDADYEMLMPTGSEQRRIFRFSDFRQPTGWGKTVAISEVLRRSNGLAFRLRSIDLGSTGGTESATLSIKRIELYK